MSVVRRLLAAAGGGGSFTPPPALAPFALSAAAAGGWTQITDPHAVYYNGRTYFAYVRGDNGDACIRSYDHATATTSAEVVLHANMEGSGSGDIHDAPSLLVRDSDHRIITVYSKHVGTPMYVRISTNPEDASAFGSEANIASQLGGTHYTYPTIFEQDGAITLIYRDHQSSDTVVAMALSTSTDGGTTWAAQTVVYNGSTRSPYWVVEADGESKWHVAISDGHPVADAPTKVGHFYNDAGAYKKSNGTSAGSLPLTFSAITEVYDAADGSGWPSSIALSAGQPLFTYEVFLGGDTSYRVGRWTGSAWSKHAVISAGGSIEGAAGHIALDRVTPSRAYASVKVASHWELQEFTTADDWATWSETDITTGSSVDNLIPANVRNHGSALRVLWVKGTYTSYLIYSLGVSGTGL